MRKHCLLVASFLLWVGLGWGQNQALTKLRKAEQLFDSLRYQESAILAKDVLKTKKNPEINAQALILLGNIAVEQADSPNAKALFLQGLQQLQNVQSQGHPLIAQIWNNLGEYELKLGNFQQALQWHRNALNLRIRLFGKKHEKTADSYNNIGNCLIQLADYVAARQMHQRALAIRRAVLPPDHADLATSHNNLGTCAYFIGDFQEAAREYRIALQIREKTFGAQHNKTTPSLNNLGKVLFEMGQWDQAMSIFQKVLNIRQKAFGKDNAVLAPTLENIGEVYLEKGDFSTAIPYLQQAVFLYGGSHLTISAPAWHKIGLCYQRMGKFDAALQYHVAALQPIKALYGDQVYAAAVRNNLANCYMQKKEYPLAIENFGVAAEVLHQNFPEGHPDLAQMYNSMAICYIRQGFLDAAQDHNSNAFKALQQIQQTRGVPYAQVLRTRAQILLQQGKIGKSATVLQKALRALSYRNGQTLWGNEITQEVMEVLAQQGRTWAAAAISSKDQTKALYLQKKAAQVNLEALRVVGFLRRQISTDNARQLWLQQQYTIYQETINLNFRIWQQSGDQSFLERAFILSEKSKGAQLLNAVQLGQANAKIQLPKLMSKLEQNLLGRLAALENEKVARAYRAPQIEREMLGLMRRLDSLQKVIAHWQSQQGIVPVVQDTVYSPKVLRRKLLKKGQALVEYFETESSLLVFVLSKRQFTGFSLPKPAYLRQKVVAFRIMLKLYPALNGAALDSNLVSWTHLSLGLYRDVFKPLKAALKEVQSLVLVPDGSLGYLPFEALLTKQPKQIDRFKSHPYLLREYAISYSYSGSLSLELCRKSRHRWFKPRLLAFAPSFQEHSLNLGTLYNNIPEAQQIGKLWGAKVLIGHKATLQAFRELAPQYDILHLATHGKYFMAKEIDDYSAIAFAEQKDSKSNEYLYTRDLYAMHLPVELVVLSACETGIGDYHSGEGVISLAHGFIHAGAKSVVNTLWSVDDARTAELMVDFFRLLKKGESRDRALQHVKLNLIANRPHDEVHPYYWAGLIEIGVTEAVYDPLGKYIGLGGVLCLLLGFAWVWFRFLKLIKNL